MGEAIAIPPFQPLHLILRDRQSKAGMVEDEERFTLGDFVALVQAHVSAKGVNDTEEQKGGGVAQTSAVILPKLQAQL